MRRLLRLAVGVVFAMDAGACATVSVSSHAAPGFSFAHYRTYEWGPADAVPAGDPRLENDPFFEDKMLRAVEKGLAARGLERAAPGSADLLIHYHASISTRIDVNRIDREHGDCYDEVCGARVIRYEAGTLILDLVDARTDRVIWRGWAQRSFEGVLGNHGELARMVNESVARILERLPRLL